MDDKIQSENGSGGGKGSFAPPADGFDLPRRLGLRPVQLLAITIVGGFLAEVIAMIVISFLGEMDYVWLVLVDASIMTVIVFPVLYLLSFRPLLVYLDQRELALAELHELELELEQRVEQRTIDLNHANQSLANEIAERKQAEEQLRYQATLLENVSDAIIASDLDFNITSWNQAAETLYGWRAEEVIGKSAGEILFTEYAQDTPLEIRRQFLERGLWKGEVIQKNKDGARIDILASVSFVKDITGTPIGAVSVNRDITERKQAEAEIQSLAKFPGENPNPVLRMEHNGKVLYANPSSDKLLRWWNCGVGEYLPENWSQAVSDTLEAGRLVEHELLVGEQIYSLVIAPIKDGGYVNIYGRDITERKRAEEALRLSEERFAKAFRASPAAISITRLTDGRFVDVNETFIRIFGYSREELLDRSSIDLYDDPNERLRLMQRLQEEKSVRDYELIARAKTGEEIHVLLSTEIITLEDEAHVLAILYDITERKRMEQAIILAKQEWERTFDAVPDLVAILDEQHNIMRLNRPMAERIGRTPRECIGLKCYDIVHGLTCAPEFCPHLLTCQDGQTHAADIHEPRLGGDFLVSTTPLFDPEGKLFASVHVARDITEQKVAERALRQARDELELRVQERTMELALANESLASANEKLVAEIGERIRAEQALIQTNELLERYFSSIDTLIAYMDRDFNFIRVNEAYAKSSGYPTEYFLGKNHFALYPHQENQEIFQQVVQTGEPFSVFEKPFEYPDHPEWGVTYWDWSLQPVKGMDETVEGLVLSLVDVTGRKRAEQELARQNQDLLALSQVEHELREFAESLAQSAISLNTSLELDQVLVTILEQIHRVIPFTTADILLKEGRSYRIACVLDNRDISVEWPPPGLSLSLEDFPLLDQIFSTLQPLLIGYVDGTADWQRLAGLEWVRSYVGAPLVAADQVFGIINLHSDQPRAFDQRVVEQLMAYTAPAAAAMQNAWLFEQVRSSREHLQALSRRLVEVQEGERRYIASELHDEVGQALTGLTLGLQLVDKKAEDAQIVRAEVAEMNRMLEGVLEELHRLAMDLRPASLDHLGLTAALRQHVAMVKDKYGLMAQFEMVGIQDRLPDELEIAFYRIVQEALNNVVRHAKARRVDVILEQREDRLVLIVEDDGVGFDPEAVNRKGERLGLFGMQERAEMLGGELIIESKAGKGTTILVEVPYDNAHTDRG